MIAGVEQVFHLIYEGAHWSLSWCVPKMEMIEATDEGILVTGKRIRLLKPGYHWYNQRMSTLYTTNVKPRPHVLPDQLLTTKDGKRVRAGGVLVYKVVDINKWLIENHDSEESCGEMAAHALREVIITSNFAEMQEARAKKRDALTQSAQEMLSQYGVRVEYLRLSTFAETDAKDLYHSGVLMTAAVPIEDEDED